MRRGARAVPEAETLGELFGAVRELLEFGSSLREHAAGDAREGASSSAASILARGPGRSLRGAYLREGVVCWSWERGDIDAAEVISSRRFWTLRLPLSTAGGDWGYVNLYRGCDADPLLLDVDYLCNLFQREMAEAAERILGNGHDAAPRDGADKAGEAADKAVVYEVSA